MIKIIYLILIFIIFYFINKKIYFEHFNEIIPNNIIQICILPLKIDNFLHYIDTLKKYNKNYNYILFNEYNIDDFLKYNYSNYYNTYLKLPIKIQKLDFFRYIAIYHYGGFYMDLDIVCFKSFDKIRNNNCIFPIDTFISEKNKNNFRFKKYYESNNKILLGQYAFGAQRNNEFIKYLIENIHNNIDLINIEYQKLIKLNKNHYKSLKNIFVYKTTGPDFVTDCYISYKKKENIKILNSKYSQTFGDFASHKMMGSWK